MTVVLRLAVRELLDGVDKARRHRHARHRRLDGRADGARRPVGSGTRAPRAPRRRTSRSRAARRPPRLSTRHALTPRPAARHASQAWAARRRRPPRAVSSRPRRPRRRALPARAAEIGGARGGRGRAGSGGGAGRRRGSSGASGAAATGGCGSSPRSRRGTASSSSVALICRPRGVAAIIPRSSSFSRYVVAFSASACSRGPATKGPGVARLMSRGPDAALDGGHARVGPLDARVHHVVDLAGVAVGVLGQRRPYFLIRDASSRSSSRGTPSPRSRRERLSPVPAAVVVDDGLAPQRRAGRRRAPRPARRRSCPARGRRKARQGAVVVAASAFATPA